MASMTIAAVDHGARMSGLVLSADELAALVPIVTRMLEALEPLESLPLAVTEPAIQFRVL